MQVLLEISEPSIHNYPMLEDINDDSREAVGRRLLVIREASGLSQEIYAERIGAKQNAISYWENGRRPIPAERAKDICRLTFVTLDWIYFGDPRGLNQIVREKLEAFQSVTRKTA